MTEAALFDLLSWMSPAWPIGAFAHSGGLEWAVEAGLVHDRASTAAWFSALLEQGPVRNDAVLFVHAWRAVAAGDAERLREVAELALALQTGFERRLESTAQGMAFGRIAGATVPPRHGEGDQPQAGGGACAGSPDLAEASPARHAPSKSDDPDRAPPPPLRGGPPPHAGEELAYPIAAATLFAQQGIALVPALTAWLHGAAANLVSAAQRLVPLGQTDAQLVLRDLRTAILDTAEALVTLPEGDPFEQLGGAALLAELGCMAHETQYTRLFRT